MCRSPGIRFGIIEHDAASATLDAWVLAGARAADAPGMCWLPSGNHALTARLERTLAFVGAAWTVDVLDAAAVARELEARGAHLPEGGAALQRLTTGAAARIGGEWAPGQPVVLGIGEDGALQACKFALLARRSVQLVPDRDALPAAMLTLARARSLLIAPGPTFDSELLRALDAAMEEAGVDIPHGWLYPFGCVERDYALLKCVIFGRAAAPEPRPFHLMFPLEANADVRAPNGDRWVFGQALPAADSVSLLQKPADFLAITGHSNGVDMGVGAAVLCPREGCAPPDAYRVLPCFHGAECSRKSPRNELCAGSSIGSLVTMLYTCWGVVLHRHIYDVRGSLLFDIVKSPATGAIVATYASTLMDANASVDLAQQYGMQVRIGDAVQSVNAEHYRRYRDMRHALVLFGDPEHRNAHQRLLLDDALRQTEPIARLLQRRCRDAAEVGLDDARQCASASEIARRIAAIDHLRLVVAGHRALHLEAIGPALAKVGEGIDRLWLWQTRHLLRARQYGPTVARLPGANYFRELQHVQAGLFEFFGGMVAHLGGALHLQMDGLFCDDETSSRRIRSTCPYCGSASWRVMQRMVADDRVSRHCHKCDNCAVVQDGDASIAEARFVAQNLWPRALGAGFRLYARFATEPLRRPFLAGAVIEPFHKRRQPPPMCVVQTGTVEPGSNVLDVAFEAQPLPQGLVCGSYFLNGLILVGERHVVMRRAIYVR